MSATITKPSNNQQTLNEQTTNSEKHALIQQVNDWECNSINEIRKTADEARQLILKHTTKRISEIETKLKPADVNVVLTLSTQ